MLFTAATDAEMETFLVEVGRHLGTLDAEVYLDLFADDEITEPGPRRLFDEMRREALEAHRVAPRRSWWRGARREPSYMGESLDLSTAAGLERFARLAHRVIGCEAVLGDRLVFSTVENERTVWLGLPAGDVDGIVARAGVALAVR
ncbi:hypothetical protein JNUCC64_15140 [Streptomyces sp. JNUCC 64]